MSKWRNMMKAVKLGLPPTYFSEATKEELGKLEYIPVSIPKIDHAEELRKMREQRAVRMIRTKVDELNAAIAKGVEFGIKVEIDTLDHYRSDRPGCPATHLTATISKTL